MVKSESAPIAKIVAATSKCTTRLSNEKTTRNAPSTRNMLEPPAAENGIAGPADCIASCPSTMKQVQQSRNTVMPAFSGEYFP